VLTILGAACAFGSVSVLAKLAYEAGSTPRALLAARVVVAALLLGVVGASTLGAGRIEARDLVLGGGAGISFAGAGLLEFEALARLPAPTVVVLLFVAPAWVALCSWVLWRAPLGRNRAVLIGVVVVGIALLAGSPGAGPPEGRAVLAALAASVLSATFFLLAEQLVARVGPRRASCLTALGGALVVTLADPHGVLDEVGRSATAGYAVAIGALTAGGLGLLCLGLRRASALSASAMVGAEPLVAAALSWLLLGELLSGMQLVGAAVVLAGVTGLSVQSGRAVNGSPPW
jgi:drug/metabolite transporter (DMT)-like permease